MSRINCLVAVGKANASSVLPLRLQKLETVWLEQKLRAGLSARLWYHKPTKIGGIGMKGMLSLLHWMWIENMHSGWTHFCSAIKGLGDTKLILSSVNCFHSSSNCFSMKCCIVDIWYVFPKRRWYLWNIKSILPLKQKGPQWRNQQNVVW